jgi:hypothetical protein
VDNGAAELAPIAVREVLGFPIRLLKGLPLNTTLVCSFTDGPGRVALCAQSTQPLPETLFARFAHGGGGQLAGPPPALVAFVGPEVHALALAAEHDRATAVTMHAWCAKKPGWTLTPIEAIGKLGYKVEPLGWSVEQVLRPLGLQLDEVWL